MIDDTKLCTKCNIRKPLEDFCNRKDAKDGKQPHCAECNKIYRKEHKEEISVQNKDYYYNKGGREKAGHQSMYENKSCAQYLGIVAAERLCKHLFKDVEVMPYGFPGYDLICNRGKKINVKASTIHIGQNENSTVNRWSFYPNYNKSCDFFLCMAFDNIEDLNPLIAWMIPGNEVNDKSGITISSTTIHKWNKWKMDITDAQSCCNLMKDRKPA